MPEPQLTPEAILADYAERGSIPELVAAYQRANQEADLANQAAAIAVCRARAATDKLGAYAAALARLNALGQFLFAMED